MIGTNIHSTREARRPGPGKDPGPAADLPETVIEPDAGWTGLGLGEVWKHRELLLVLTWRDIKARYKQTLLGAGWAVFQPALVMVVFTVFLARMGGVPAGDLPYPLFVYAGLLPWTFFSNAVLSAGNSVVSSENLITKVYFPRLVIPFASAGAGLIDFGIALGGLVLLMAFYGIAPGWPILLAPLVVLLLTLAAVGIGTLVAALGVKYRDFRQVFPFLVQVGMFATPVIYMQPQQAALERSTLPAVAGAVPLVLALNPVNGLIGFFRACFLGGPLPWADLAVSAGIVAGLFVVACLYFRRVESSFADII